MNTALALPSDHPLRRKIFARIEAAQARVKMREAALRWREAVTHGGKSDITDMLLTLAIGWRNQSDLTRRK